MRAKNVAEAFMLFISSTIQQFPPLLTNAGDWVLIIEAVGSLFLSIMLVVLYFRMYRTQQYQTEAMTLQGKVMAASFRPDIQISLESFDGNKAKLQVTNRGEERAKNISLACQLYFRQNQHDDVSFEPAWNDSCEPMIFVVFSDLSSPMDSADRVQSTVNFGVKDAEGIVRPEPFSEISSEIEENREIGFDFFIMYENHLGNKFTQWLSGISEVHVQGSVCLEEAINQGSEEEFALLNWCPSA